MIAVIDRHAERINAIKRIYMPHYFCAVVQSAEQLHNLALSGEVTSVIADADTLEGFENGWETLQSLSREDVRIILLSDRYSSKEISELRVQSIHVLPSKTEPWQLESLLLPEKDNRMEHLALESQKNNLSRLRDHLFNNLLEEHDLPSDVPQMMEFLGLQSPTHKYYLALVFSCAANGGRRPAQAIWEIVLRVQKIACEEISKIAQNRSCLRAPDRIAMVLLMKEPGDPFRYVLENVLEIIRKRVDRECGCRISVGVGLAGNTIDDLISSYRQACDALDQGGFFGSFVCFFCDLWDRDSQRFQILRPVKEQITQCLYNNEILEIDKLLESQFRQFYTSGVATRDNILALKIDIAVFLMDLSDKLSIVTEKPKFYSQIINDCLQSGSLPALEIAIKQYLRDIISTSQAVQGKRTARIIHSAKSFITEHTREPINVQLLAQQLHISPNYLSALFKAETGVRLTEYITNVKMQEAARLIRDTEKNIIEIADILSYDNANYFSRLFKKHYNLTPSDYRLYSRKTEKE